MPNIKTQTQTTNALPMGPVAPDILNKMIADAAAVQLHENCDVPGVYFNLLILPALKELRQLRAVVAQADGKVVPLPRAIDGGAA